MDMDALVPVLGQVFSITIIDLTLSGDNAAVIGLAIRNLPPETARKAAIIGALGAVILRMIFTAMATKLSTVPYLSAFGSLLLIYITIKLMMPANEKECGDSSSSRFWGAVWSIIIADLSMALDNVLAVAGAAHGSTALVVFGLGLSIPILIWGSTWVATVMNKFPIIIFVGAAVLAHTAGVMLLHDKALHLGTYLGHMATVVIPWVLGLLVMAYGSYAIRKGIFMSCPIPDGNTEK